MLQQDVTIINKLGLHARAAARFVTVASKFDAEIKVLRKDREVNGKSIMGVMMLAAGCGSQIQLIADGCDETAAMQQLVDLIADRFGEAE